MRAMAFTIAHQSPRPANAAVTQASGFSPPIFFRQRKAALPNSISYKKVLNIMLKKVGIHPFIHGKICGSFR